MDSQLELSTTSILSLFETTKEQRQDFISRVVQSVENGEVDPLKVHLQIKCMEKIIEGITSTDEKKNKEAAPLAKRYKAALVEAAEKFGAKEFEFMNAKIKIGETGTKYDYSKCGDPELAQWTAEQTALAEKIKTRQELLQKAPVKGMTLVNEETGETYTVYPPSKSSSTSLIVTLK